MSYLLLDQFSEATTALKLPAEADMPASRKSVRIHPEITAREASLADHLVVINRFVRFLPWRRSCEIEIDFLIHDVTLSLSSLRSVLFLKIQADCLYLPESVLDPNSGQSMTCSPVSCNEPSLILSKVRSCTLLPVDRRIKAHVCRNV